MAGSGAARRFPLSTDDTRSFFIRKGIRRIIESNDAEPGVQAAHIDLSVRRDDGRGESSRSLVYATSISLPALCRTESLSRKWSGAGKGGLAPSLLYMLGIGYTLILTIMPYI